MNAVALVEVQTVLLLGIADFTRAVAACFIVPSSLAPSCDFSGRGVPRRGRSNSLYVGYVEVANVYEVTSDRGGCGHHRAYQVRA
jgi:hypothetical protein